MINGNLPITGFPYTEEDVHGNDKPITRDELQCAVYATMSLNYIFEENKKIKIKGKK